MEAARNRTASVVVPTERLQACPALLVLPGNRLAGATAGLALLSGRAAASGSPLVPSPLVDAATRTTAPIRSDGHLVYLGSGVRVRYSATLRCFPVD